VEFGDDPRHLVQHIEELAVGMTEILPETMERDDHPICVAGFTGSKGLVLALQRRFFERAKRPGE